MKLDDYYWAVQPSLKIHILSECTKRGIPYKKLWNGHRKNFFRHKIENCSEKIAEEVNNYLFIFDFCLVWFSHYAELLAISFFQKTKSDYNVQHNVLNLISWRICADLAAVRCLALEGFDVQAKQVVRSTSESIDALGVAVLNADFALDFVKNQDIDENKKTWFKYIAKGKARKCISTSLHESLEALCTAEDAFRDQEETVLSAAAHPSFISGFVSLFPEYDEESKSEKIGVSKFISPFSIRTLMYCCYRVSEHCLCDLILYKTYERFMHESPEDWNKKSAQEIKNVVNLGREISFIIRAYISNPGIYSLNPIKGQE